MAVILALVMIVSIGTPSVAGAAQITLSYANFPPAPTFPSVQMERWKTEVEKRTNGKVQVNTFPGGTLLEAKNMYDGVVSGVADIGCFCMAYQPGRFLVTNATSLPLGIPNAKVGSMVLWDVWEKYKPEEFKEVKVLTMFTSASTNIMSTTPIKTLDDIKGASLRASGGAAQILTEWNARVVGMPMPATVEALQKGVVNGLFSSLEVMKDLKFAETCKFVTMTDTVVYPFAVIMNKAKWDSLPDDVKKVFEDLAVEQVKWTGDYVDKHTEEAMDWSVKEHKVEVIRLTPEQLESWNSKLNVLSEKWADDANKAGLPGPKMLQELKEIVKKNMTM